MMNLFFYVPGDFLLELSKFVLKKSQSLLRLQQTTTAIWDELVLKYICRTETVEDISCYMFCRVVSSNKWNQFFHQLLKDLEYWSTENRYLLQMVKGNLKLLKVLFLWLWTFFDVHNNFHLKEIYCNLNSYLWTILELWVTILAFYQIHSPILSISNQK